MACGKEIAPAFLNNCQHLVVALPLAFHGPLGKAIEFIGFQFLAHLAQRKSLGFAAKIWDKEDYGVALTPPPSTPAFPVWPFTGTHVNVSRTTCALKLL